MMATDAVFQTAYERVLADEKLKCSCDEGMVEIDFRQAGGHHHSCELYQVVRAMKIMDKVSREARDAELLKKVRIWHKDSAKDKIDSFEQGRTAAYQDVLDFLSPPAPKESAEKKVEGR